MVAYLSYIFVDHDNHNCYLPEKEMKMLANLVMLCLTE